MKYTVAVRTLCEFTAKLGDLDLRFTPSATALEGVAGHAAVAARRGEDYEAELTLRGEYRELVVRGRADGFDPGAGRLDEVKTYRGDLAAMPANRRALHWAQAKVYGALLC
ncbi:MAG TPA: ATP-dependent DNA helicase, partial [Burkholderiaceae bacterium]